MKKVLAFGTFDLLHEGHIFYLKKAKEYGNLVVIVARDETVKEIKGKYPINNEKKRLDRIISLDFVDAAYLGFLDDKYKIIEIMRPEIICLGYDQTSEKLEEELKRRKIKAKIIRIPAYKPEIYKSSLLQKSF